MRNLIILLALGLSVGGCNGSKSALETAASPAGSQEAIVAAEGATAEADEKAPADTATVLRKPSTVTQKGNYIRVLVNGDPITNYDVERRGRFRQLRRLPASREASENELIDEAIKLQEADQRGFLATDAMVDTAFANFAKGNKSTPTRIAGDLDRIGVGAQHFKDYIRAQISWNRTVSSRLQSETRSKTQNEAIFELRKAGADKPETTEYQLQQIIFVVPQDKRAKLMKTRKVEALAFVQNFAGCERTYEQAKLLRDVAVKDLGRLMQPELPPLWADDISKLEVGRATPPKETDNGVETIAVCKSRVTNDDRAAQVLSQTAAFGQLEEKGNKAADDYLAELRKKSVITHR